MKRSRNSLLLLLSIMAVLFFQHAAFSSANFAVGREVTVHLPPAPYQPGFTDRGVVLRAHRGKSQPGLVAAVSVETEAGGYTCALVVLLGDVKVWASDHFNKFVPNALCRLELTVEGQLRLTDGAGTVGWASGTAGLGIKVMCPSISSLILICIFCFLCFHMILRLLRGRIENYSIILRR
jgi:hypothetical protein